MRLLDKYEKLKKEDFRKYLEENQVQDIEKVFLFMNAKSISDYHRL